MKYNSYPTLEFAIIVSALFSVCPVTNGQCEQTKLVASDGSMADRLGIGVDLSGDGHIALLGAYTDDENGFQTGSAYIMKQVLNSWVEVQKLVPNDISLCQQFGRSVAITADGSLAVIGAWKDDEGGLSAGSAYVFAKKGDFWLQQGKLIASDSSNGDNFGVSVDISSSGKTVIVGSYLDFAGSAYVFQFDDSNEEWTEQAKLTGSDSEQADQFGVSVAISANGNSAIIGAHKADGLSKNTGAAYVFTRVHNDIWSEQAKLFESGDNVGHSVALSDDGLTALIGAPFGGSGRALVFNSDGVIWVFEATLLPFDGDSNDQFGHSVALALDGRSAAIGARRDEHGGFDSGSAYYFSIDKESMQWVQHRKFLSSDIAAGDKLGTSSAIAGSTMLVGAMNDANQGGEDAGAAYIFSLNGQLTDCNHNMLDDACEILSGADFDCNSNDIPDDCDIDHNNTGVPDDCEANGDLNGNGFVNTNDLLILLNNWGHCNDCNICPADLNGDCTVGTSDLLFLLSQWSEDKG